MNMNTRDDLDPGLPSHRSPTAGGETGPSQMQFGFASMPSVPADFNPSPPHVAVAFASRTAAAPAVLQRASLSLQSLDMRAVRGDAARLHSGSLVFSDEPARVRALSSVAMSLDAGHSVEFECSSMPGPTGRPDVRVMVHCDARAAAVAEARRGAEALRAEVKVALEAGFGGFRFEECQGSPTRAAEHASALHRQVILPAGLLVEPVAATGFLSAGRGTRIALPLAPRVSQSFLDDVLRTLFAIRAEVVLRVTLASRNFPAHQMEAINDVVDRLTTMDLGQVALIGSGRIPVRPTAEDVGRAHALLRQWQVDQRGVDVKVVVESDRPVAESLARLVVGESMAGRPFDVQPEEEVEPMVGTLDLRGFVPASALAMPVLPSPAALRSAGTPDHLTGGSWAGPTAGIQIGHALTRHGDEPAMLPRDGGHAYIIGQTGTGKSCLLQRLIRNDIEAGFGVFVLDPLGELVDDVKRDLGNRAKDLVPLDFTRFDRLPGFNPLRVRGEHTKFKRNRIVGAIGAAFSQLHRNVPEALGPIFFSYMRNALGLLMEVMPEEATLLDVQRLFVDPIFRKHLVRQCEDDELSEFWTSLAERTGGDASLENIAIYIVSKFNEFGQNVLVRDVVGQQDSTFDLLHSMDEGQIVLVNLAKGVLGETNARFLGFLLTSQLMSDAMSRYESGNRVHRPFRVYIDEFHEFVAADALKDLMSQSRRYGITAAVAHQDLAQLSPELSSSVLGNASIKAFLRVSAADAKALSQELEPHVAWEDLTSLPDYHAVVRPGRQAAASAPSVVRLQGPEPVESESLTDEQRAAIDSQWIAHTRNVEDVERELRARRDRHLPEVDVGLLGFSDKSAQALRGAGVHQLKDWLHQTEEQAKAIKEAMTVLDRFHLARLVRRLRALQPAGANSPKRDN